MYSCEHCGGPKSSATAKYCSNSCSCSAVPRKKPTPARVCVWCGSEFKRRTKSRAMCCSYKCAQDIKNSGQLVDKTCVGCGAVFKAAYYGPKACSDSCRAAYLADQHKVGRRTTRNSQASRPLFDASNECQLCGNLTWNAKYCSRECYVQSQVKPISYHLEKRIQAREKAQLSKKPRGKSYKMSAVERKSLLEAQKGLCALCRVRDARVVDHCHVTGRVRGLLCHKCNSGLGGLGDNVQGLRKAITYLESAL